MLIFKVAAISKTKTKKQKAQQLSSKNYNSPVIILTHEAILRNSKDQFLYRGWTTKRNGQTVPGYLWLTADHEIDNYVF